MSDNLMQVSLFSDGACRGNPGPGGYGTILRYVNGKNETFEREYSEGFKETTNNQMELLGVITGLEKLTKPCDVTVYTDSKYVVDAFNAGWVDNWQKNGWKTANKKPVKNQDLWMKLLALMSKHTVTYVWIKGHDGHPENERCDKLATDAADNIGKA